MIYLHDVGKVDLATAATTATFAAGVTVAVALADTRTPLPLIPSPPRFPVSLSSETRGVARDGGQQPLEVAR